MDRPGDLRLPGCPAGQQERAPPLEEVRAVVGRAPELHGVHLPQGVRQELCALAAISGDEAELVTFRVGHHGDRASARHDGPLARRPCPQALRPSDCLVEIAHPEIEVDRGPCLIWPPQRAGSSGPARLARRVRCDANPHAQNRGPRRETSSSADQKAAVRSASQQSIVTPAQAISGTSAPAATGPACRSSPTLFHLLGRRR